MKSFLVVEKGEQLLTKNLENELLQIKVLADKLNETVRLRNKYIEQIESENIQLKKRNQYLIENLTTPRINGL